jgi:transposase
MWCASNKLRRTFGLSVADGSRHDCVLAPQTLDTAFIKKLPQKLIADRAFDSKTLADRLRDERGIELIAPLRRTSRSRRQDGRSLRRYRRRWKVERLIAWLKRFRRVASRWERLVECYLRFMHLACIRILLRHHAAAKT